MLENKNKKNHQVYQVRLQNCEKSCASFRSQHCEHVWWMYWNHALFNCQYQSNIKDTIMDATLSSFSFFYTYLHAWARKKYIRLNPSVAKTYFSLEWCLNCHNHYFLIKTCLSCSFWSCCTFTPVSVRQTSHFQHRQCKTPPKVNSIRDAIWLKLERFPWLKKNSFSPPITGDKVLHVNVTMHNSWGYVMP